MFVFKFLVFIVVIIIIFKFLVFIVVIIIIFEFLVFIVVIIIFLNDYFTYFYVKHFELPLCMKCAI